MSGIFADSVAVVTGAGSGMGRCLAQQLAAKGSSLALADVSEKGLDETIAGLGTDDGESDATHRERGGRSAGEGDSRKRWQDSTDGPRSCSIMRAWRCWGIWRRFRCRSFAG